MKFLIVSFFDDNFGDMLIRICFEKLLKTVLKNLNVTDFTVERMPLKEVDEEKISAADMIFFPGGALFGLNYLNFFEHIDKITTIAEENSIPVIFSSLGINNMDATEEGEQKLVEILKRNCIKSISVRENAQLFRFFAKDSSLEIVPVCDPAVWTKYVYNNEIQNILAERKNRSVKTVGINVVRGGLFKDNGKTWTLGTEEKYLIELKQLLENEGLEVRFFTNGSTLDDNALAHFAKKYQIPDAQLVFPAATSEMVEAIAGFDVVITLRMHASIISYALDIPSVNLVWNDKISFFYENIGYSERAIPIEECTSELVFEKAKALLADNDYSADENFLMTLYMYLYRVLSEFLNVNGTVAYSFEEVAKELELLEASDTDDEIDFYTKIERGRNRYLSLFTKNLKAKKQIKELCSENEKQIKQLNEQENKLSEMDEMAKQLDEQRKKLSKMDEIIKQLNEQKEKLSEMDELTKQLNAQKEKLSEMNEIAKQLNEQKKKLSEMEKAVAQTSMKLVNSQKETAKLKRQIDRINSYFVVRVYKKIAKWLRAVRKNISGHRKNLKQ